MLSESWSPNQNPMFGIQVPITCCNSCQPLGFCWLPKSLVHGDHYSKEILTNEAESDIFLRSGAANGLVLRGKLGKKAYLEKWITTITSLTAGETAFTISFDWDESMGVPGALMVRNHHHSQFYLKTITLEDVPGHGRVHFVCNSWVYPAHRYNYDRIFFSNKVTFIWS